MSRHNLSRDIGRALLNAGAVVLRPDDPFTWASGLRSPIYCDNRLTLAVPPTRSLIADELVAAISRLTHLPDAIAGVATAGIPQATLVADRLQLPLLYVRSAAKRHGRGNRIEGRAESGSRVVVIEDLISTGGSSLEAVEALRGGGVVVQAVMAVFSYGLPQAADAFASANVRLITLADLDGLLEAAEEMAALDRRQRDLISEWRVNPQAWSDART